MKYSPQCIIVTIQSHYNINDYISYAVLIIQVTYLSHNWKLLFFMVGSSSASKFILPLWLH